MAWNLLIPALTTVGASLISGKATEKAADSSVKATERNIAAQREAQKDQQLAQNISNLKSSKLANLIAKNMKEGGSKQYEDSLKQFREVNQSSLGNIFNKNMPAELNDTNSVGNIFNKSLPAELSDKTLPQQLGQTPAAISKLQNLIRAQALPEQRAAASQARLALEQQGVRGPESALLQAMQTNRLQGELANRAEQIALQQSLADRDTRINQLLADRGLRINQGLQDRNAQINQLLADRDTRIKQGLLDRSTEQGALLADRGAMQDLLSQLVINSQEAARTPVVEESELDEIFKESEPNDNRNRINRNRINRKNITNRILKDKEVEYMETIDDLNNQLDQAVKNNDTEQIEYLESQLELGDDLLDKIYAINEYEQNLYYDQGISGLTDKEIKEKVNDVYYDVIWRRRERPELNLTNKEEN